MRYLTGMVVVVSLLIFADQRQTNVHYYNVDYFELNHTYDDKGKLIFDQIILWEWVNYRYYDEDSKLIKTRRESKVTDWYMVTKYRKKLTEAEQKQLNKALEQKWIKEWGNKAAVNVPPATPPFEGGMDIPRYDPKRKTWKIIIRKRTGWIVVYATSFVESWTQHDPETANQKLFSSKSRKHYLKRIK